MARPRFDLQSHSTYSDGALPPAQVVQRAAAAGIELLALTDHDTVDGVDEALTAAREAGIAVIPAVEISAVDPPYEDLHVLGYAIDHHDPGLMEALVDYRADRLRRSERMAAALRRAGWHLDQAALDRRRAGDRPIGRPHLAAAVASHPGNAARLATECLATPTDVLVAYLTPGAPAYCGRERPTVVEAIAAIQASGGLAVWAHPFWDVDESEAVVAAIERYVGYGLDGVEAFYVTHTEAQARLLHATCQRLGLQTTGSADFHGPEHPRFSRFGAFELHGLPASFDIESRIAGRGSRPA
jgi:predicted metal-dependent phosphoesterase TrpH